MSCFDRFSENYEQNVDVPMKRLLTGEAFEYFIAVKVLELERTLTSLGALTNLTVADVGCGTGLGVEMLSGKIDRAIGIDVSIGMLDKARSRGIPNAEFIQSTDTVLPLPSKSVDALYSMCLFHHIPPGQRTAMFDEMRRVVRPGGLLITFEHNPLNILTQYVVRKTPVDKDAVLLTASAIRRGYSEVGIDVMNTCYILFFPRFLSFLRRFEQALNWLPFGAQYYVVGQRHAD